MWQRTHVISGTSLGTSREVHSFHFGTEGARKVYIQAGLHASELPGMLVSHYLREILQQEEANGNLVGEVVLVPVANPIGLDQTVLTYQMGRFDLYTGENFNRYFPDLSVEVAEALEGRLGPDGDANVALARAVLRQQIERLQPLRHVDALRKVLLRLSCDADIALDLHCDCESVLHLYAHPGNLEEVMPLAALMGAQATLYALEQGNSPFDEVSVNFWVKLQKLLPDFPMPTPTISVAIELRGQLEVSHRQAREDAGRILDYLRLQGVLRGRDEVLVPPLYHKATPLDGTEVLFSDAPGVIVYLAQCGDMLEPGDPVVDVLDPVVGEAKRYCAGVKGVLFARQNRRYAMPGMDLAYIAGETPLRGGHLLSA